MRIIFFETKLFDGYKLRSIYLSGYIAPAIALTTVFFILAISGFGCVKPETFPVEPIITQVEILPDTIKQTPFATNEQETKFTIRIHFTDGDGDIGQICPNPPNPNDPPCPEDNTFITDNRTEFTFKYKIPYLTPPGKNKTLQGYIDIEKNDGSCCLPVTPRGGPFPPKTEGVAPASRYYSLYRSN